MPTMAPALPFITCELRVNSHLPLSSPSSRLPGVVVRISGKDRGFCAALPELRAPSPAPPPLPPKQDRAPDDPPQGTAPHTHPLAPEWLPAYVKTHGCAGAWRIRESVLGALYTWVASVSASATENRKGYPAPKTWQAQIPKRTMKRKSWRSYCRCVCRLVTIGADLGPVSYDSRLHVPWYSCGRPYVQAVGLIFGVRDCSRLRVLRGLLGCALYRGTGERIGDTLVVGVSESWETTAGSRFGLEQPSGLDRANFDVNLVSTDSWSWCLSRLCSGGYYVYETRLE
ncbi:hypothetical protein FPV67DRAFT_1654921 [Lyophyllum atratum]|nr:hypothetical protein FPV67DRAFT_1654921 [Lyophyllum atratum]